MAFATNSSTPYYQPVQPSAPPMPPPPYSAVAGEYSHPGFFGAGDAQPTLGHQMLEAVIANKTDWVIHAKVPKNPFFYGVFNFMFGSPEVPNSEPQNDAERAKFYLTAGRVFFAETINCDADIKNNQAMMKSNEVFHNFIEELAMDESYTIEDCYRQALKLDQTNPEIHFEMAKLHFLRHEYSQAVEEFHQAYDHASELSNAASSRVKELKAIASAGCAAAFEREGLHDLALFEYIHAANIDPKGKAGYEESLSRSFQILKFKQHKSDEELAACMEYDPYDPTYTVELAEIRLQQGKFEDAMKLINQSNELAYYYKPNVLFRCAELTQQAAFCINNAA